jgi:hypothetical protein
MLLFLLLFLLLLILLLLLLLLLLLSSLDYFSNFLTWFPNFFLFRLYIGPMTSKLHWEQIFSRKCHKCISHWAIFCAGYPGPTYLGLQFFKKQPAFANQNVSPPRSTERYVYRPCLCWFFKLLCLPFSLCLLLLILVLLLFWEYFSVVIQGRFLSWSTCNFISCF